MQKFINILVILLAIFSLYYGVLVDYNRVQTMDTLLTSDEELQGHKRVIDEEYRRLSLKFDGRGKHMQRMAADIVNLRDRLNTVTDSLGSKLDEVSFLLTQVEENLLEDIRAVSSDLRLLGDELRNNNRRINRSILDIQERLNVLESDLRALTAPEEEEEGDR